MTRFVDPIVPALLIAVSLAASLPNVLWAQAAPASLSAGDTLRYRLVLADGDETDARTGTLESVTDTTLLILRTTAADTVPLADLASLEVARGSRNYVVPMAAIGGAVGCAAGVAIAGPGGDEADPTNHRIGGCVIGLGVGIAAGIFAGGRIRSPRWMDVALSPDGGVALSLRLGP